MALLGKALSATLLPFKHPVAGGAAVGAAIGYAGNLDPTNAVEGAAKGALFGAGAIMGAKALIKYGPGMARKATGITAAQETMRLRAMVSPASRSFRQMGGVGVYARSMRDSLAGRTVAGTARGAAGVTRGALGFAERHPTAALYMGTAAVAGIGIASVMPEDMAPDSPTLQGAEVNISYNQQAIAADQMMSSAVAPMGMVGSANQMMGPFQRELQRSTTGLVQGLHRSRH